ncbi:DPY30/SDC1 family protein [Aspergillus mulundensis]|uniref:COMPASS complex subunit Sdc1 n=1 Tax=Aspergillus mulundensis TaxID=1810919 RepID=A0A3D8SBM5_9EURO|nr:hypothetical protein DSM5745_04085 [Aspergillus mulundensis]RDW83759.1 hypothetical protein DSM5745_04085 [Aspergillus mulundensis]
MTENAPVSPIPHTTSPPSSPPSHSQILPTIQRFLFCAQHPQSTALNPPDLIAHNTRQTTTESVAYPPTSHPNFNPSSYYTPPDPAPAPHPPPSAGHPRSLFRTPTPNPNPNPSISTPTPMANENAQMSSSGAGAAHTPTADSVASTVRPGGAPARVYMNEKIVPYLLEGMKTVTKEQPANPLRVLGEFLIQKSNEVEGQSGRAPE